MEYIPLRNEKEWTTDTHNSVEESQNNIAKWNKPDKKRILPVEFHVYKTLD